MSLYTQYEIRIWLQDGVYRHGGKSIVLPEKLFKILDDVYNKRRQFFTDTETKEIKVDYDHEFFKDERWVGFLLGGMEREESTFENRNIHDFPGNPYLLHIKGDTNYSTPAMHAFLDLIAPYVYTGNLTKDIPIGWYHIDGEDSNRHILFYSIDRKEFYTYCDY